MKEVVKPKGEQRPTRNRVEPMGSGTVLEMFAAQVMQRASAVAVVFESSFLTYGELDRKSTLLAHELTMRGIGVESIVGICLDRGLDKLVAVLAVLKSGASYLPLDPTFPTERLRYMVADSGTRVVVSSAHYSSTLLPTLAEPGAITCVPSEGLTAFPVAEHSSGLASRISCSNRAYVIYTSGSTGRPKGVEIEHGALANFLTSMAIEPGLSSRDVLLAVTTLSFDIAVLELLLPLVVGARVVIVPRPVAFDGEQLSRAIAESGATVMQATPASWQLLLDSGWSGSLGLKALCGGEALPDYLAARLLPRCAELWNLYGPTETTVWSTCCRVLDPADVHIGRPIANTEVFILDPDLQPVISGSVGELFISGAGLARGYLNQPELTAERFITNPRAAGQRLYRTGDLARLREEGNLDCLGRVDFQVKIRGFRIELGEVESQLSSHSSVRRVVVIAHADASGEKRLIAYLVPADGARPSVKELRRYLHERLPSHMVPAMFIWLDAIPLTPNGKVDRNALPWPGSRPAKEVEAGDLPRNDTEARLLAIFSCQLGAQVTSIDDSFFDLGGSSLQAARMIADVETELGVHLSLASLLAVPTIRKLAEIMTIPGGGALGWGSLVPIGERPGRPALYMVHGAGGNVLLYRDLAAALGPDVAIYGFQSQGLDRKARPLRTVEEMAAHYVRELRVSQPNGPYHLGGYCMGGAVAYEMARLLHAMGESTGVVALLDSYNFTSARQAQERVGLLSKALQKIRFHFSNVLLLRPTQVPGYFFEKARMLGEAVTSRFPLGSSPGSGRNRLSLRPVACRLVHELNDAAAWKYVPQPSAIPITVFRPKRNYDYYSDPNLGWREVAGEALEIVEIPVNPHGMLIKPFCDIVACELKSRIDGVVRSASLAATSFLSNLGFLFELVA